MKNQIHNINVIAKEKLPSPKTLKDTLPLTKKASKTVLKARKDLISILDGKDDRLAVVVGPCSIHDVKLAKDYAERLKELAKEVSDTFLILRMEQMDPYQLQSMLLNHPGSHTIF